MEKRKNNLNFRGGYTSIREYTNDFKIYAAAKELDLGRDDNGDTISSVMKKRIEKKLVSSTSQFKKIMRKNNYTKEDLILISTHSYMKYINNMEHFIQEIFNTEDHVTYSQYRKILKSNALKSGRLDKLYPFIYYEIKNKKDFLTFLKMKSGVPRSEIRAIMNYIGPKEWHSWFKELLEKGMIHYEGERCYI